jgi:hypothetical protein
VKKNNIILLRVQKVLGKQSFFSYLGSDLWIGIIVVDKDT